MSNLPTQEFLVFSAEDEFEAADIRIVSATSEDDAIYKYVVAVVCKKSHFLEDLFAKTTNLSFAEKFWGDSVHNARNEADFEKAKEYFARNIREHFGERQDFADQYLNYYFSKDDTENGEGLILTDDFLFAVWKGGGWAEVTSIPLPEVARL